MLSDGVLPGQCAFEPHRSLGMTFTISSALPPQYRNGVFVGEHGSWNRNFFNSYKVVYIPFENGKPAGKVHDGDRLHRGRKGIWPPG